MSTQRRMLPPVSLWTSLAVTVVLHNLLPVCANQERPRAKFKAAVYEHAVILPEDPKQVVSREEALRLMQQNLAVYSQQAAEAKRQGADILVFPEDGLYGFSFTWESMEPYLEFIPDPEVIDWIPCDDPTRFKNTEVQHALSCMAKNNSLYLVANIGDSQPCHRLVSARCNHNVQGTNEHFQYNTDVAFDPEGKLVARYHKKHLFFEKQFDEPETAQISTFDTPFGRWAMFTCFDILFYAPAVAAVEKEGIANIAFPTAWMDALPLLASVEFHSAFARGMGVNFLAANIHLPAHRFQGSGVFTPNGQAAFVHNATVTSQPRLIVTEIDVLVKPGPEGARTDAATSSVGSDVVEMVESEVEPRNATRSEEGLSEADRLVYETAFVSYLFNDLFNFVQLEKPTGTLRTCSNKICCHLTYSMTQDSHNSDLFAFGAFDGLHTFEGRYYLQICALVRCANQSRHSCGSVTNQSSTSFQFLSMRGELETEYVYPEVLLTTTSNQLRLAQAQEWSFVDREIKSETGFSFPLLAASLFGRVYSRDDEALATAEADTSDVATSAFLQWYVAVFYGVVSLCVGFMTV